MKMDKLNKNEIDKMIKIADNYIEFGEYDEAMEIVNVILREDKENFDALLLKSEIYYLENDFGRAERTLNKAIAINPNNDICCFRKAMIEFSKLNFTEAHEWIDKCLAINPNNWDGIMAKANFLRMMRKPEYSIWLDKAFKLDKKRAEDFMKNCWIDEPIFLMDEIIGKMMDKLPQKIRKKKVKQ